MTNRDNKVVSDSELYGLVTEFELSNSELETALQVADMLED